MICPKCGCYEDEVINSRKYGNTIRRRRECQKCGFRFNTVEVYENEVAMKVMQAVSRDLMKNVKSAVLKTFDDYKNFVNEQQQD